MYTVSGVFMGIWIGVVCNYNWETNALQRYYWGYPGEVIMMNMLKCIIIPLIIFSITTGVASMAENSTVLSGYAVAYYLITTIVAIINGIIFSVIIRPGKLSDGKSKDDVLLEVDENQAKADFATS